MLLDRMLIICFWIQRKILTSIILCKEWKYRNATGCVVFRQTEDMKLMKELQTMLHLNNKVLKTAYKKVQNNSNFEERKFK